MKYTTYLLILFLSVNLFAQNTTTLDAERDKSELLIGFNRRSDGATQGGPWWTDTTFTPLLAQINPDVLRYPGGTQANYWDWTTGKFLDNTDKNWGNKEVLKIPEFLSVIPARTKVVYVVNMARPTPATGIDVNATEEILKSDATLNAKITDFLNALATFDAQGKLPYAVELGNEYFFGNVESGIFHIVQGADNIAYAGWDPSLNSGNGAPIPHDGGSKTSNKKQATVTNAKFYLYQCKEVVSQIKAVYPIMKFALVTTKRGNGTSSRESWNTTVYDELATNPDFSTLKNDIYALTQHHYLTNTYGDQTVVSDIPTSKVAIAEGVSYPRERQADYDQSPAQYKIWYTEFGATKVNADESWAGGMRAAVLNLSWMDRGDKTGQLDYHHITDENVINTAAASMRLAPIGITSMLLEQASADMITMNKINFNTNPDVVTGIETLHGYKFKNLEKETLLIININDVGMANIKVDNLFTYAGVPNLTQYWSTQPWLSGVYLGHANIQSQTNTIGTTFTANGFSITVIEVANSALSVGENDLLDIRLYPNPVSDILTITAKENINSIVIYDINGKQILSIENPSERVDVSELKPAVYLIKIITDSGVSNKKLIKK